MKHGRSNAQTRHRLQPETSAQADDWSEISEPKVIYRTKKIIQKTTHIIVKSNTL